MKTFSDALETTKTVIWNGPMGVFEFDKFAVGTEVCKIIRLWIHFLFPFLFFFFPPSFPFPFPFFFFPLFEKSHAYMHRILHNPLGHGYYQFIMFVFSEGHSRVYNTHFYCSRSMVMARDRRKMIFQSSRSFFFYFYNTHFHCSRPSEYPKF